MFFWDSFWDIVKLPQNRLVVPGLTFNLCYEGSWQLIFSHSVCLCIFYPKSCSPFWLLRRGTVPGPERTLDPPPPSLMLLGCSFCGCCCLWALGQFTYVYSTFRLLPTRSCSSSPSHLHWPPVFSLCACPRFLTLGFIVQPAWFHQGHLCDLQMETGL